MSRSVAAIALGSLGSKALGMGREVLFAGLFGTGSVAAAYRVSQTGFLMPIHSLIGDTLGAGLLPLYRKLADEGPQSQRLLLLVASVAAFAFSAVTTVLLMAFADEVCRFIAPGADASALALAARLLRIMALATPFYVFSGMLGFIEAAYGSYGAIAWRPSILNLGAIAGVFLAYWLVDDDWLAISLVASHVIFLCWTLLQLRRYGGVWPVAMPTGAEFGAMMRRFMLHVLPLIGLPLIAQANVLAERVVSSRLGTAVIPAVDYARFISDTAVQLIALPLGVLTMATLGGNRGEELRIHIAKVAGAVLVLSFPIGVLVAGNAEALVRLLFARGAFDAESIAQTVPVLVWMGGALGITVTSYYLIKALNAQLRNRAALAFTALAAMVNIAVNFALWPVLGNATIGLGFAAYSTVLLLCCLTALGLLRPLAPLALAMVPGLAVQGLVGWALTCLLGVGATALALNAALALALWLGMAVLVAPVRDAAAPALGRLPLLRRFWCR